MNHPDWNPPTGAHMNRQFFRTDHIFLDTCQVGRFLKLRTFDFAEDATAARSIGRNLILNLCLPIMNSAEWAAGFTTDVPGVTEERSPEVFCANRWKRIELQREDA